MKICLFDGCDVGQFGGGYCKRHQYKRTDKANKHRNKIVGTRSPIRRYKLPTSNEQGLKTTKMTLMESFGFKNQKEMFDFIWSERPHICELSGKDLNQVSPSRYHWMFSHILAKKNYPFFKLNKQNILLLHPDVHYCVDNFTEDMIEKHKEINFVLWFAKVEQLKKEYKCFLLENML